MKGSTTFVNLTKALDVRVQLDEKVLHANSARFSLSRTNYQTDHINGKILLMNYKSEDVAVVLNMSFSGKMSNYSIEPQKDVIKANENVVNPQHNIQWKVTVKPRQPIEIKYTRLYSKRV